MNNAQTYYEKYLNRFSTFSIHQLIESFNVEVGKTGWTTARGCYMRALRDTFDKTSYELDPDVFKPTCTSYKFNIQLFEGKIIKKIIG